MGVKCVSFPKVRTKNSQYELYERTIGKRTDRSWKVKRGRSEVKQGLNWVEWWKNRRDVSWKVPEQELRVSIF